MIKKNFVLVNEIQKAFTLIELLITIAIIGVLSAAVLIGLNPVRKINQANDSKVKSDVAQISTAEQSYNTTNGFYASSQSDLVTSNDLNSTVIQPSNYTVYTIVGVPSGCSTNSKNCTNVAVGGQLKAPAIATNTLWCWLSSTNVSVEATTCP